jgi:uncharacterized protein (TIGR02145 family)
MKKLYFYALLLSLWGLGGLFGNFAFAEVSVELIGNISTQVSFTVSWTAPPYDNKIWVLAQYAKSDASGNGPEERALVTEVNVIGATASTITGYRGFWLETSGDSGSATVTATLSLAAGVEHFNWCVYAFDYPPNAVLQADGTYQLRGSPPFTVNGDKLANGVKTFGAGTCITSVTDATDNPEGIILAVAWYSGGETSQTVTVGDAITPITFEANCTTCTTGVTSSGLPYGVSGTWTSPNYTVSGIPLLTGTYSYTLTAENGNGCSHASINGVIKVEALPGTNQNQGNCTFTQPAVVSTFALFPANYYSASTFVTLTDERDGNNYTVVKMPDGKWWMAQALNYQKDLTWQANSNQPSTGSGQNTALIGHFWCPGATNATTSTRTSCDVWGALYSFETAMMVDGKWSDDNRTNTAWTDVSTGAATNGGKGAGSHGICPANWHVPTDAEWGNLVNTMGTNACSHGKSTCTCNSDNTSCVDDIQINWFYNSGTHGLDTYNFRVISTGTRDYIGSHFFNLGDRVFFWSSSASSSTNVYMRRWSYGSLTVGTITHSRSYGFPVRCVRN